MTKVYFITIISALTLFCTSNSFAKTSSQQDNQQNIDARLKQLEEKFAILSKKTPATSALENIKISGRLHVDGKWFNEKTNNDSKKDGIDIRRARLAIEGDINNEFHYKFDNDFANNASNLADAYIAYTAIDNAQIRVGSYRPPFSLEQLVSSNSMVFIERSVASTHSPVRHVGFEASAHNQKWHFAAGLFGESTGNQNRTDDSEFSASARTTFAPINNESSLLHVGIAGFHASKNRNTAQTGANITANPIDKQYFIEAELLARQGSTELQAEYTYNNITYDKNDAGTGAVATTGLKASFNSYYIQIATILTGEHRSYSTKNGTVSGFKVKSPFDKNSGTGAWEIAARYSNDNRNDIYNSTAISLGNTKEITLGVNWYMNNNVRIMLNYQNVETRTQTALSQRYNGVTIRTQLIF